MYMSKEEVKEYIKSNPEIYFEIYSKPVKNKKKEYVCPLCQNGTGEDCTGGIGIGNNAKI